MLLFFSAARVTLFGKQIMTFEEGHAVLMRAAMREFQLQSDASLPQGADLQDMIFGNQRTDMPNKRRDGTISPWGAAWALFLAHVMPKYHHAMRQPWHHPSKHLDKVQQVLFKRLLKACIEPDIKKAAYLFGGAMHTLQDSYTFSHAKREDNGDVFSPLVRLEFSPSRAHPPISKHDRVWANAEETELVPPAKAAITATVAALETWSRLWGEPEEQIRPELASFVDQYVPIRGKTFYG